MDSNRKSTSHSDKETCAPRGTVTNGRPELLDTKQAAQYLGLREHTLEVWRSSGRYSLPFIRCGGKIRYRREALDRFLDARTVGAEPESAE